MPLSTRVNSASNETRISEAIDAFLASDYQSVNACATDKNLAESTLRHRLSGRNSCSLAMEHRQILSPTEEETTQRVYTTPISRKWLTRFRARHPAIEGTWIRQIENARYKAVNVATLERWFDAVTELFLKHSYDERDVYNIDESGFSVGASQSSRVLVNIREKSSWKVVHGRQEWITAIKCVSALGRASPPLLIFKAKHLNSGWISPNTPSDWVFSTSNSG